MGYDSMKFYVTFEGVKKEPNNTHYVIVEAPCEDTCIQKLKSKGLNHWSTLYRSIVYIYRQKLKLWGEL